MGNINSVWAVLINLNRSENKRYLNVYQKFWSRYAELDNILRLSSNQRIDPELDNILRLSSNQCIEPE